MCVEHVDGCDMRQCGGVRDGVANCILRREHIEMNKTLVKEHMAYTVEFQSLEEMEQCALICIEQSETLHDATDEAFTWIAAIQQFLDNYRISDTDPYRLQQEWFQLWQFGEKKFGPGRWNILHIHRDGFNPYTKRWLYVPNVPHV